MYCSELWGNTYVTNLQCIVLVRKTVFRVIHGANRWDHTNNLFYNYRILKSNDIVELKTILFMFGAYRNILPNDLQQLFVKSIPSYSACRTHQFHQDEYRQRGRTLRW